MEAIAAAPHAAALRPPRAALGRCSSASAAHGSSSRVTCSPPCGAFWGVQLESSSPCARQAESYAAVMPKIEMAISKEKKKIIIATTKKELENCFCIAAINHQYLSVKQVQELRAKLPEGTRLMVVKNRLLGKAVEGTPFAAMQPALTGANAFLFVHSEEIPAALKPYRDMQKEQKLDRNDFTGAVFEGKFYGPESIKSLETMPTRLEIYAKLLGTLKGPPTQVVGMLQAPARDLVFTLKAYVAKLEEEQGQAPAA